MRFYMVLKTAFKTAFRLQGAAQYNGLVARVVSYDGEAGRYTALVDGGKTLKLKRQNLRL